MYGRPKTTLCCMVDRSGHVLAGKSGKRLGTIQSKVDWYLAHDFIQGGMDTTLGSRIKPSLPDFRAA